MTVKGLFEGWKVWVFGFGFNLETRQAEFRLGPFALVVSW